MRAGEEFSLARLPSQLERYLADPAQFKRLHTIYYDSEDLRLARWACGLRYRVGEGWTLKILRPRSGAGGAIERKEYTFKDDSGDVPQKALDLARGYLRGAAVAPVIELRTVRTKRTIRPRAEADAVAEVDEDDVAVVDGTEIKRRFKQVEIEALNGSAGILDEIRAALCRTGVGPLDPLPKNVRALEGDLEPELPRRSLRRRSSPAQAFAVAFSSAAEQLVRLDAALRAEDDADVLHEIRTAVRRLRAYLRDFRPTLDRDWAEALRERLGWLNRLLAKARNTDVLLETLKSAARALEPTDAQAAPKLIDRIASERNRAYEAVHSGLREQRYAALLDDVIAAARAPVVRSLDKSQSKECSRKIVRGARRRLCRAVEEAAIPPAERDLHAIRIKAKHVRFVAEALTPIGAKRVRKLARSAKRLQKLLGEHHDSVMALRHLRDLARGSEQAFVAGEIAERSRRSAEDRRDAWRRALRDVVR
ncbi:MAG: CHAD domain-containing protein [Candidatus Eremiobacteraeota bacterium]|nr:CHAD domain-containing protein [Candidatus Eremiobacteraeota bacterium]